MEIEWDRKKAATNFKKHQVKFAEAATTLLDPRALAMEDPWAVAEQRWVLTGLSSHGRLLTVVYAMVGDSSIGLISARKATSKEAFYYA
jgi:uncharacterized protein